MLPLTSGTFTLVVKVNSGTANGTVITGKVSVASSAVDPISTNNTATVSTVVGTTAPNLTVTNVASPNPVVAGTNITYTQVVTNTGSSAATNGTFSEATPTNTTFVSITPPAGWTCTGFPAVPCQNPSVGAGVSGTFTVLYKVNAGTTNGTVIIDTVTVNASNQSFGSSSATATDVVGGATQADLALSTAASPSTVLAGNDITYTQTVTNNGPGRGLRREFHRSDTSEHYVSICYGSGGMDVYVTGCWRHRKCYLHQSNGGGRRNRRHYRRGQCCTDGRGIDHYRELDRVGDDLGSYVGEQQHQRRYQRKHCL